MWWNAIKKFHHQHLLFCRYKYRQKKRWYLHFNFIWRKIKRETKLPRYFPLRHIHFILFVFMFKSCVFNGSLYPGLFLLELSDFGINWQGYKCPYYWLQHNKFCIFVILICSAWRTVAGSSNAKLIVTECGVNIIRKLRMKLHELGVIRIELTHVQGEEVGLRFFVLHTI